MLIIISTSWGYCENSIKLGNLYKAQGLLQTKHKKWPLCCPPSLVPPPNTFTLFSFIREKTPNKQEYFTYDIKYILKIHSYSTVDLIFNHRFGAELNKIHYLHIEASRVSRRSHSDTWGEGRDTDSQIFQSYIDNVNIQWFKFASWCASQ